MLFGDHDEMTPKPTPGFRWSEAREFSRAEVHHVGAFFGIDHCPSFIRVASFPCFTISAASKNLEFKVIRSHPKFAKLLCGRNGIPSRCGFLFPLFPGDLSPFEWRIGQDPGEACDQPDPREV